MRRSLLRIYKFAADKRRDFTASIIGLPFITLHITQQQNIRPFMRQTYIINVKYRINDTLSAYLIINQNILGCSNIFAPLLSKFLHVSGL
jgi:hypothetical protein